MSIIEATGTIKYKDSNGNLTFFYPTTLKDNVSGMEEIDTHISSTSNPHNVTAAQIGAVSSIPVTATGDGTTYTATVDGITELTAGVNFVMIPDTSSTDQSVTLNVNGLGAKPLRRRVSAGSSVTASGYTNDWLAAGKPVRVMYDGLFWTVDIVQAHASDLMGSVPITKGGTGATDGSTGLANLLAAGNMVLSTYQYGDTLPDPGVPGRIFFKEDNSFENILQAVYPVGSIYISTVATSPASLFGGTWEQIKDVFLLAAGDTYTAGDTGGEATHTITTQEMPEHTHSYKAASKTPGNNLDGGFMISSEDLYSYTLSAAMNIAGHGQPMNIMPPYLTVYVWKRVA